MYWYVWYPTIYTCFLLFSFCFFSNSLTSYFCFLSLYFSSNSFLFSSSFSSFFFYLLFVLFLSPLQVPFASCLYIFHLILFCLRILFLRFLVQFYNRRVCLPLQLYCLLTYVLCCSRHRVLIRLSNLYNVRDLTL